MTGPAIIQALRHERRRLVRINTLFHHSEKYRHPWELLSILSFGRLHLRVE